MEPLASLLARAEGLGTLVLGDALLDDYLIADGMRIAREAPVPVVEVAGHEPAPGGAANVAANLAALGARVRFLTVLGDDRDGDRLLSALQRAGVPTADCLRQPDRRTIAKRRLVSGEQLLVRFDEGRAQPPSEEVEAELVARLELAVAGCELVVISDYGYGLLTDRILDLLGALLRRQQRICVLDTRSAARYRPLEVTAVTPSAAEALSLLGVTERSGPARAEQVASHGAELLQATGARIVAVTLDRDGAVVCERDRPSYRTYTRAVPDSRACGAGDTYAATFALLLGAGAGTTQAAEAAQAAASVVTAQDRTTICSSAQLRAQLAGTGAVLEDPAALADRLAVARRQGRRVVFTNGCFDLLHRGHVDLLNRAKALGDLLVVALNSDAGVAALKGPDRPINGVEDRASVLAALSCVDHLVQFDEPTAAGLVARLRPDLYVKGGDYTEQALPEAAAVRAAGGDVRILPYLSERSTSQLVARIRA